MIFDNVYLYQFLVIIIAVIAIYLMYTRFKGRHTSLVTFIIWDLLWIFMVVIGFYPPITDLIAKFFGFNRGLDIVFVIAIGLLIYLIFRLYSKIEKQDKQITKLIRLIAINNEENLEDDE